MITTADSPLLDIGFVTCICTLMYYYVCIFHVSKTWLWEGANVGHERWRNQPPATS